MKQILNVQTDAIIVIKQDDPVLESDGSITKQEDFLFCNSQSIALFGHDLLDPGDTLEDRVMFQSRIDFPKFFPTNASFTKGSFNDMKLLKELNKKIQELQIDPNKLANSTEKLSIEGLVSLKDIMKQKLDISE